jgi:hypothetical protein
MVIEIFLLPHYVAPFTAVFYAIGLQAMRHLRVWKPEGKPAGLALTRLMVAVCVLLAGVRIFAKPLKMDTTEWEMAWFGPQPRLFGEERAQIEKELESNPGPQLAIVRYGPTHKAADEEWVYNEADIDDSKVVWARELDPGDNLKLIRYYAGRKIWLVEPDTVPARISPYPMPNQQEAATIGRKGQSNAGASPKELQP